MSNTYLQRQVTLSNTEAAAFTLRQFLLLIHLHEVKAVENGR